VSFTGGRKQAADPYRAFIDMDRALADAARLTLSNPERLSARCAIAAAWPALAGQVLPDLIAAVVEEMRGPMEQSLGRDWVAGHCAAGAGPR